MIMHKIYKLPVTEDCSHSLLLQNWEHTIKLGSWGLFMQQVKYSVFLYV